MAVEPDKAVVDALVAASIGLVLGTNLFRGEVRAPVTGQIPGRAVFALTTGGPVPTMFVQGNTGPDVRDVSVQVRVRGDVGAFEDGQALAESVWKALQRVEVADYMSVAMRESAPASLGQDDTEHPEWSMNVDTRRED